MLFGRRWRGGQWRDVETDLSWSVWVWVVEPDGAEAERVSVCLDGGQTGECGLKMKPDNKQTEKNENEAGYKAGRTTTKKSCAMTWTEQSRIRSRVSQGGYCELERGNPFAARQHSGKWDLSCRRFSIAPFPGHRSNSTLMTEQQHQQLHQKHWSVLFFFCHFFALLWMRSTNVVTDVLEKNNNTKQQVTPKPWQGA